MKLQTTKRNLLALLFGGLAWLTASAQQDSVTLEVTLPYAIEIALAENPTMRVADKDIQLKQIADKEAWMNLLPTLDGSLQASHSITVAAIKTPQGEFKMGRDGTTTAIGGLTLALPVFAPAVYQNMKLTKEDILLAQEKARSSRLDLINQVKKAYYAALLSKEAVEVMKRSCKVTQDNFDIVNNKFKVGTVSEYDKISAEVQLRSMQSSLVSAETSLELAVLRLKVVMGINTLMPVVINDSLKEHEGVITLANAEASVDEIENNSTLRQLDMNKALLERTRKILKTNFMPTVALQMTAQYQSYSNDDWNIFKYKYNPSQSLALAVNIPIFHATNWTKLQSNRIQLSQLADTRENTKRQLRMASVGYRKNMLSSLAKMESDREAVKQADKAVKISGKRYEVGHGTILELNQSETALVQAELTFNQGLYDYLTNKADFDYTLGRE